MDQRLNLRRTASLPRVLHRVTVWLHDFAGRLDHESPIMANSGTRHWMAYYKLLQRSNLCTAKLGRALLRLVIAALLCDVLTLVLDDILNLRCSKKAPGVAWWHEHSSKTNRPKYVWVQYIVTLGVSVLSNGDAG